MPATRRKILVTTALPYANGSLHIGHMLEHIQSDIWVRFQRMRGHEVYSVCADDAHGTPVMLKAKAEGVSPETLIERMAREHVRDFADFGISFDNYYTTHSDENRALAERIFHALDAGGHVRKRTISQAFDPVEEIFLPDRFIRGACPKCGAADQYGDSCESCGSTHAPSDLVNPYSAVSGATPVAKDTEHYFFALGDFEDMLKQWTAGEHVQEEVRNKLKEWFDSGLKDWDISRDAPYFGFEIPGETDKYFYVWLDAPIGYFASFKNLCERIGLDFESFVGAGADAELYHFIGKDILYFHTLFWPAMLHGSGFKTPDAVFAHGFLTVNGQKMSKSRGTFVSAREYLNHLPPDYLRYYLAAKLNDRVEDLDLNLEDFAVRVNSDLVGKVVNIASRCAGFVNGRFDNRLAGVLDRPQLVAEFADASEPLAALFEARRYSRAIRDVMELADRANRYVNERRPWEVAKDRARDDELHAICTTGLNLFRVLITYLAPVTPALAERAGQFLNLELLAPGAWRGVGETLPGHEIAEFRHLLKRLDLKRIDRMIEASKPAPGQDDDGAAARETGVVGIDEFAKLDLRVARIVAAQHVEGADRLLKLTLDIGSGKREVFAGIRSAYEPDKLIGRLTAMVANLAPRKMRFGVSEGMLLVAGSGDRELFLLAPDDGAQPGMRIT